MDPDSGDTVVGLHSLNDNNNEHSFGTSRDVIEHLAISPLTVLDGVAAVILDHVVDGEPQFATWLQTIGHIINFIRHGVYLLVRSFKADILPSANFARCASLSRSCCKSSFSLITAIRRASRPTVLA